MKQNKTDETKVRKGKRQTGRTTRMVQKAHELDLQGRVVYIVALHDDQHRIEGLVGESTTGIKVETLGSLRTYDLEACVLHGAHPNCVVLVDHSVIEHRFEAMLKELHRYDN